MLMPDVRPQRFAFTTDTDWYWFFRTTVDAVSPAGPNI
jgi:hypothetical protein